MDRIQPLNLVAPARQNVSPTQVRHLQTLPSKESGCWAFLKKVFYCIFCCFEPRNRPIDANHPLSERVISCPAITRTVPQPEHTPAVASIPHQGAPQRPALEQPAPAEAPTQNQEAPQRQAPRQPVPVIAPLLNQAAPRRPMLERPVPAIAPMPHQGAPERRAPEQPARVMAPAVERPVPAAARVPQRLQIDLEIARLDRMVERYPPDAAAAPDQEAPQRRVRLPAITNLPRNNELWSMAQYLSEPMDAIANWERIQMTPARRNVLDGCKNIASAHLRELNYLRIRHSIPHSFLNVGGGISDKGYFCLSAYVTRPAFLPSYSLRELGERVNARIPITAIEDFDDAESRILGLPLNTPPIQPEQIYTLKRITALLSIKTRILHHYHDHPEEVAQIPQDTPRSPEGRITDMGYYYLDVNLCRRVDNLPSLSHEEFEARMVRYCRNEIDDITVTAEERAEINRRREAAAVNRRREVAPARTPI